MVRGLHDPSPLRVGVPLPPAQTAELPAVFATIASASAVISAILGAWFAAEDGGIPTVLLSGVALGIAGYIGGLLLSLVACLLLGLAWAVLRCRALYVLVGASFVIVLLRRLLH